MKYKFRGKCLKTGKWVYGNYEEIYDGSAFISYWVSKCIEPENDFWEPVCENIEVDPKTVGMYSGIFDFTGKEIYEGDFCWYGQSIRTITFKEGCFLSEEKGISSPFGFNSTACAHLVCGNIHDHDIRGFFDEKGFIQNYKKPSN